MEYKNITEAAKEAFGSDVKEKILADFREYLEKKTTEKEKKKHSNFIKKALEATTKQISFGNSPGYAKGYVYGNVTARGWKHSGDTTYTRTISVDLQTPEYTFFSGENAYETRTLCKQACIGFPSWKNSLYSARKDFFSQKRESKAYILNNDAAEALKDYATDECDERLWRLDYKIEDCRVNDYNFVQTQEPKLCNFYPVYLATTNKKGQDEKVLIGFYNANNDSMYSYVDFKAREVSIWDVIGMVIFAQCRIIPIIAIIIAIIVAILM